MTEPRKAAQLEVARAMLNEPVDGLPELLQITTATSDDIAAMLRAGVIARPVRIGGREQCRIQDGIRIDLALDLTDCGWSMREAADILGGIDWPSFALSVIGDLVPAALVVRWGGEAELVQGADVAEAQAGPWDCIDAGTVVDRVLWLWTGNEQPARESPVVGDVRLA